MASIQKRNNSYCVVYSYKDSEGKRKQKWETYKTRAEAERRRAEVEYKEKHGKLVVPSCSTFSDLIEEFIRLYGKDKWSLSAYKTNVSLINNYIVPVIGDTKLSAINTRYLELYYEKLQTYPAVANPYVGKPKSEFVTNSNITKIHKLLRSCFNQAVKWGLMEQNPALDATVPKHKEKKREIWEVETLMKALDACEDERLKLAMLLAFTCTLRLGEVLGLMWSCTDISEEAIREQRAFIYIDKELQRVDKEALKALNNKDVILIFPEQSSRNKTVRVLKTPKTEDSIRKVFLPDTVARMLSEWKKRQDELKSMLGKEYQDYGLVLATNFGMPLSDSYIHNIWNKLISDNGFKHVDFHSLRHSSITYKLKLNGGDIKSVQGDSGHSQSAMVTEVYSHVIEDDRRKNAELFEKEFFNNGKHGPAAQPQQTIQVPEGVDPALLNKVFSNPEMLALLSAMAKSVNNK